MVKYKVIEENLSNSEIGSYRSYGICAYDNDTESEVCFISDVFLHTESAVKFTNLCNELMLDVLHLPNVIEDYLQSIYIE